MTRKRRIGDDTAKLDNLLALAKGRRRLADWYVAFPDSPEASQIISSSLRKFRVSPASGGHVRSSESGLTAFSGGLFPEAVVIVPAESQVFVAPIQPPLASPLTQRTARSERIYVDSSDYLLVSDFRYVSIIGVRAEDYLYVSDSVVNGIIGVRAYDSLAADSVQDMRISVKVYSSLTGDDIDIESVVVERITVDELVDSLSGKTKEWAGRRGIVAVRSRLLSDDFGDAFYRNRYVRERDSLSVLGSGTAYHKRKNVARRDSLSLDDVASAWVSRTKISKRDTASLADLARAVATPIVSVASLVSSINEGSSGSFRISRTGGYTEKSLIIYNQMLGTATNGVDYTPNLTGSVSFQANELEKDITITAVADALVEPSETIIFNITTDSSYVISNNDATMIINGSIGSQLLINGNLADNLDSWTVEQFIGPTGTLYDTVIYNDSNGVDGSSDGHARFGYPGAIAGMYQNVDLVGDRWYELSLWYRWYASQIYTSRGTIFFYAAIEKDGSTVEQSPYFQSMTVDGNWNPRTFNFNGIPRFQAPSDGSYEINIGYYVGLSEWDTGDKYLGIDKIVLREVNG